MFGNRNMGLFGQKPIVGPKPTPMGPQTLPGPTNAPPAKPISMGPQTLPGPMQGAQPPRPGGKLAKTLLDMQFNRTPTSPFTALAGIADIGADAWNERRARRAGVYQTEE